MKLTPVVSLAVLVLAPVMGCAASNHDFDAVVSAVEHRYQVHAQRIPMMGFVSFCAHVATVGGVKGMRIAEFDHFSSIADTEELAQLVSENLGNTWQRFVTERGGNSKLSVIYVWPEGKNIRMLIADLDHGELDVVRMELNGDRLAKWMRERHMEAHQHSYEPQ